MNCRVALLESRGQSVHVFGGRAVDGRRGDARVQLRIIDVSPADPVGWKGAG